MKQMFVIGPGSVSTLGWGYDVVPPQMAVEPKGEDKGPRWPVGVNPVVEHLREHGEMTAGQVAKGLGRVRGAVSGTLSNLHKQQRVTRTGDLNATDLKVYTYKAIPGIG